MAEQLKNILFTKPSIQKFADEIVKHHSTFDKDAFFKLVFVKKWENLELKAKMHHLTGCLYETLPKDYKKTLSVLLKTAPQIRGFEGICFPDYVEKYGLDYWNESLQALKEFTKYSSSEFGIRPFIIKDQKRTLAYLLDLSKNENEHIRRFSSEGCRPRLPWAMALPALKKDPKPILPILENLKEDKSEYVRKSVANNLNDISKDHPDLVLEICQKWKGTSANTDWIIKRACRTLLKAGNPKAMQLFGYKEDKAVEIQNFKLNKKSLKIGEEVEFSFEIKSNENKLKKMRLEYIIEYVKSKGKASKKVFMISEKEYSKGIHIITRKHGFIDMSTRKHYPGQHVIRIIANGIEKASETVLLKPLK